MDEEPTRLLTLPKATSRARVQLRCGERSWTVDEEFPAFGFGRAEECALRIEHDFVSRMHGEVFHKNGRPYLRDQSLNGTLVVRRQGPMTALEDETVLLEGAGSLRLGHRDGPEIIFSVETLGEDGATWEGEQMDSPPEAALAAERSVFRREGEYWTLGYAGEVLRLKDVKGLRCLAHLLRHPAQEFHALDLALVATDAEVPDAVAVPREDAESMQVPEGGSAGPILDAQAKAAYRARVGELRDDLAEAERNNDVGRKEMIQEELEQIATQLAGAVGLGGRDREASSDAERARVMVTMRVRDVVKKLLHHHPKLGGHLQNSVKTGRFCSYEPREHVPDWEL